MPRCSASSAPRSSGPWAPAPPARAQLAERIEVARERGYAAADEELEVGLVSAAAPVRDGAGRIVAALNVSAPKFRFGERLDEVGVALVTAAHRLGETLSGSGNHAAS